MKIKLFLPVTIAMFTIPSISLTMQRMQCNLMIGTFSNDLNLVKEALAQGANINAFDEDHYNTFISTLTSNGTNPIIFELLIKSGIDANTKNTYGNSLLYLVIANNINISIDAIKILLNAGADINIKNSNDKTTLDTAKEQNEDVFKLLENWPKELRKKAKEEISAHLIPDLSNIACDYLVGSLNPEEDKKIESE